MEVKIRFNTNAKADDPLKWRVLIEGVEHLTSSVRINCPARTTKDYVEGLGDKWHITCNPSKVEWEGLECNLL
jgi:hypothetical protein